MSDAHNEHESVIKTPKQLVAAVAASFLVPIICIVLLVQYVANAPKTGAGSDSQKEDAVVARIQPVANEGYKLIDPNAPKQLMAGADVFKAVCASCHEAGLGGAPKVGDNGAWSARIAQGADTLVAHAVKGYQGKAGMMPAKGGNPDLDDVEVARAVIYMANQSGAKFKEPEVKAAPAAAAAPAQLSADAGKKVYDTTCQMCHGAGVAGAPKLGDKAAWAPRIKQGAATLYEHAIKGFQGKAGMMPPKGGASASDDEIKAAVDYMTAASK